RVVDFGERIQPQERELEVLPFVEIEIAVEAQGVVEPRRLPADFIIDERIGLVGRNRAAPVDAARTEAGGPRCIEHFSVVELVAQVPLIGRAMLRNALVEVGAGGKEKSWAR